jgi:hypothetical protein
MTAHNVLHAAFGLNRVRDKDCSARPSHPIVRRLGVDLEEKHEPRGASTVEANADNTVIYPIGTPMTARTIVARHASSPSSPAPMAHRFAASGLDRSTQPSRVAAVL